MSLEAHERSQLSYSCSLDRSKLVGHLRRIKDNQHHSEGQDSFQLLTTVCFYGRMPATVHVLRARTPLGAPGLVTTNGQCDQHKDVATFHGDSCSKPAGPGWGRVLVPFWDMVEQRKRNREATAPGLTTNGTRSY